MFTPLVRRILLSLTAVFVLVEANIAALSISKGPEPVARRELAARLEPNARLELLRSRQSGLVGLNWTATVDFAVIGTKSTDTVTVHARKITAIIPWRVTGVTGMRRE